MHLVSCHCQICGHKYSITEAESCLIHSIPTIGKFIHAIKANAVEACIAGVLAHLLRSSVSLDLGNGLHGD
jgi:hypothetical protein